MVNFITYVVIDDDAMYVVKMDWIGLIIILITLWSTMRLVITIAIVIVMMILFSERVISGGIEDVNPNVLNLDALDLLRRLMHKIGFDVIIIADVSNHQSSAQNMMLMLILAYVAAQHVIDV